VRNRNHPEGAADSPYYFDVKPQSVLLDFQLSNAPGHHSDPSLSQQPRCNLQTHLHQGNQISDPTNFEGISFLDQPPKQLRFSSELPHFVT